MEIKKKVVMRTVAGETMLVPVGKSAKDYSGVFTLTPSAAIAFEGIQKGKTEQEIIADVLARFDIDEETAKKDFDAFIDSLKEFDMI